MGVYTRFIVRFRWLVLLLWLALTVAGLIGLPNLNRVVLHVQTNYLPNNNQVMVASRLLKEVNPGKNGQSSAVIAIYQKGGLTHADQTYFSNKLNYMNAHKQTYGISSMADAENNKADQSAFISQDKTTEIAIVNFPGGDIAGSTDKSLQKLKQWFTENPSGSHIYFTGDVPIQWDDSTISQQGVEKTAGVTVALVLIILLIVFRSLLAPLVTLLSIGISFLISSSVVAWLAERGLPVSTFTQTFLIAVLFGAGTDYSIIFLNRFREELTRNHETLTDAIEATLRSVSRTVLFSASTVLVSFAALSFAHFGLYRSAVGVSIGIFIALLAILTFTPAWMSILGRSLFWPRRPMPGSEHPPSRIWGKTGSIATRRPWWTMLVLLAILTPIGMLFSDDRTFNPMDDIPNAPSVQGFHVVANAFGQGHVLPSTIVLYSQKNFRSQAGLAAIQDVSHTLSSEPGVSEVMSATQPTGKAISLFTLAKQNQIAANGLQQVSAGLQQLQSGFSQSSGNQEGLTALQKGAQRVANGAQQLSGKISQAAVGASQLSKGTSQLASGAQQFNQGTQQLAKSAAQSANGANQLAQGLTNANQAASTLADGSEQTANGANQLAQAANQLANALAAWSQSHPNDNTNPAWQQILALATAAKNGSTKVASGTEALAAGTKKLTEGLGPLASGASQLAKANQQLNHGATQLTSGIEGIANGASRLNEAGQALAAGTRQLANGASQLANGNREVALGVEQFTAALAPVDQNLQKAGKGMSRLQQGVQQIQNALRESSMAASQGNPGFFVPAHTLNSNQGLQQAMNAYISANGHVATISVVLNHNPYSLTAMQQLGELQQDAATALAATPYQGSNIYTAGPTAVQNALNQVSTDDFVRTVSIISACIFLLLIFMLQSILAPLYIMISLMGTYFVSMGLVQTLTIHVLHKPGLSWPVPFFVFLLLVALGVDYSMFLMARFDEELKKSPDAPASAMRAAMLRMGGVVFSAAIIMAGTFGSLIVSGVTSLMEIGLAVIIGLMLYALILLGLFVPSATAIVGLAHHWPFAKRFRQMETN
ncbi:MMPL family transporter [Alicyclobacillus tolerans]|uniref:RND superfamily putative drug exporter n=1 Tax=Alicyclobacillus tolerans TaxID=90970 RepID=A0ABT9LUX9_9BACL|nr:MMPL family transporter [Alicyclobacillus tengchongensis]MDP9728071.1 RND superfamily putative drug exporter [Alicyclobacillus tengchongensis]